MQLKVLLHMQITDHSNSNSNKIFFIRKLANPSNPSDNRNYMSCHNTFRCGWISPRPLLNPFQMSVVNSLISLFPLHPQFCKTDVRSPSNPFHTMWCTSGFPVNLNHVVT
ncbi:hypothetical protein CDAR_550841 [Caerostris darwini]|uniref:Uncharacterized protein n=1 Tax=Caerostris darwini TaxID=1538125 RepID=A0AAV4QJ54_9ARAC|nr:hypothetical protein CDAR_550841 [Caerostris darwini]